MTTLTARMAVRVFSRKKGEKISLHFLEDQTASKRDVERRSGQRSGTPAVGETGRIPIVESHVCRIVTNNLFQGFDLTI